MIFELIHVNISLICRSLKRILVLSRIVILQYILQLTEIDQVASEIKSFVPNASLLQHLDLDYHNFTI